MPGWRVDGAAMPVKRTTDPQSPQVPLQDGAGPGTVTVPSSQWLPGLGGKPTWRNSCSSARTLSSTHDDESFYIRSFLGVPHTQASSSQHPLTCPALYQTDTNQKNNNKNSLLQYLGLLHTCFDGTQTTASRSFVYNTRGWGNRNSRPNIHGQASGPADSGAATRPEPVGGRHLRCAPGACPGQGRVEPFHPGSKRGRVRPAARRQARLERWDAGQSPAALSPPGLWPSETSDINATNIPSRGTGCWPAKGMRVPTLHQCLARPESTLPPPRMIGSGNRWETAREYHPARANGVAQGIARRFCRKIQAADGFNDHIVRPRVLPTSPYAAGRGARGNLVKFDELR